ncbi:MAG TPA: ABC transporter substrate-binding protein [Candidatus Cybelea sp.]|nr:ABC transporter substrate-binding protein [Candidatus Cybelea sp.]
MKSRRIVLCAALLSAALFSPLRAGGAGATEYIETPSLAADVAANKLPPVADRVPKVPLVVPFDGKERVIGKPGGELRTLIARARDIRFLTVYGYARLVVYDEKFQIKPDLLEKLEVSGDRVFTMHLRPGHKWSDGQPFTTEDFRYWWEDVANNAELSPAGPPQELFAAGEPPKVEIIDPLTVRYSWSKPNPYFLPRLAAASPVFLYRPAHYLKQFHAKYADKAELEKKAAAANKRNWAALHNSLDNLYDASNPDLPTLDPWIVVTRMPADRFIAVRNPFFHRVDPAGHQLPYIDRVVMAPASPSLIPAKTGAGESDLQSRDLSFSNFTFLKENEERAGYRTLLWKTAKGSHFALYPNLNVEDPVWRALVRDVRFRRALSLGIDRDGINQSIFFGLAIEGNDTALPDSPLFTKENQTKWATYDKAQANRLLDQIGLTQRNGDGIRLMSDSRPLEIVVETAGEDPEQTDIMELIRENWKQLGVRLLIKPSSREILRNRVYSGETVMSAWTGFENGLPTPDMSPAELAPTEQASLEWPKWGQYFETGGKAGEKIDMPIPQQLMSLNEQWASSVDSQARRKLWAEMLALHADQQFTIGVVSGVQQPIVINKRLRNVPEEGIYNFDPGAYFGLYHMDAFWLASGG